MGNKKYSWNSNSRCRMRSVIISFPEVDVVIRESKYYFRVDVSDVSPDVSSASPKGEKKFIIINQIYAAPVDHKLLLHIPFRKGWKIDAMRMEADNQ